MKKAFLILMLLSAVAVQASRRCLLIGVGHYPEGSGWQTINSVNDIRLLDSLLSKTWTVSTLCDEDATYEGICKTLDALIQQTNIGDTLLIHFSGHGQQMLTNDSTETDLLDEAFVPYDAKVEESASYHGESHFRDNTLSTFVTKLSNKISSKGLLLVTMDDCHSGSMYKGDKKEKYIYRGTSDIFGLNTISADSLLIIIKSQPNDTRDVIKENPNGSGIIFLSACKANEKNREIVKHGVHYGPLSYAIAIAYNETKMNDIKSFLDCIHSQMNKYVPFQTPQTINNLGYEFLADTTDTAQTTAVDTTDDSQHNEQLILLLIGIVSLIALMLTWKKIKK